MLTLIALAASLVQAAPQVQTFRIDGVERQAIIVPNSKPAPRAGTPVVFVFHGHGGNMNYSYRRFKVHELWPEAIAVYPEGLPTKGMTDPQGTKNGWQQKPGDEGDRDLKFTDAMLSKLHKDYKLDDHRIYVMGHSNGARFTYVLWAQRPGIFAAYAPAASPALGLIRFFKPTPAFIIAGQSDEIVPFASQDMSIQAIRRLFGSDPAKAKKQGYASYEFGKDGTELGTYIYPGGHAYPDECAKLSVEFFKRH